MWQGCVGGICLELHREGQKNGDDTRVSGEEFRVATHPTMVAEGSLSVRHVSSYDQVADVLTKPLGRALFQKFRSKIGVTDGKDEYPIGEIMKPKETDATYHQWKFENHMENFKFDSFRDEGIEPELKYRIDQIFGSYAQGKYKFSSIANSPHEHEFHEVYVPSPPHRNDEHVSLDDMNLNNGDDN
nr:polyprotein [Ipomoea batatas]